MPNILTATVAELVEARESLTPDAIVKGLNDLYEAVPAAAELDARNSLKAKAEYLEDLRISAARKAALSSPAPIVTEAPAVPAEGILAEFSKSAELESFLRTDMKGRSQTFTKDLYETDGDGARFSGPGGALAETLRRPGFVADPENATFLWELATHVPVTDGNYEYVEETVVGDASFIKERNAANTDFEIIGSVAFSYETKSVQPEWLAAHTKVSIRTLRNNPGILARLEARLAQRIALALDNALINGNGTAPTPRGILNASIGTYTASSDEAVVEAVVNAIAEQRANSYLPTVAVFGPTTWARLKTTKDSAGRFQNLDLGVATFVSNFIPENTVLLGDFGLGVEVITRGGLEVFVTDKPNDLVLRNATAVVARIEANVAVLHPSAFTAIDISAAANYVSGAPSESDESGESGGESSE